MSSAVEAIYLLFHILVLVILVSGKIFHLSVAWFGFLSKSVLANQIIFTGFWTSHEWKNNELFEIIQSDFLIVLVSRIFNCRYFSDGLFTNTRGNCLTIENESTFLLSDTDFSPFNCLYSIMGNYSLSVLMLYGSVRFVCHLYVLLF